MSSYAAGASDGTSRAKPLRVGFYIDGFNLYHGMMNKGWGRFRWLDHRHLAEQFMRPPESLEVVKYFTARVSHDRPAFARQGRYIEALKARGGIEMYLGTFEQRKIRCTECNKWYKRSQEKRTDVNIATHLVADAHGGLYDAIYLMSADADLVPAVEHLKTRFGTLVTLVDPPKRHSDDLKSICDRHLHIASSVFRKSQLPNPVERLTPSGRMKRYYMPTEWAQESV